MFGMGAFLWLLDVLSHELLPFAAVGLFIGGLDDLAIDLIWIFRTAWRRLTVYRYHKPAAASTLLPPANPGRIAIFIAAWDEAAVIGHMLRTALGASIITITASMSESIRTISQQSRRSKP